MRKYKCAPFDDLEVDLDDPKTYQHLPNTSRELEDRLFAEIGRSYWYMNFVHPTIYHQSEVGVQQRIRIENWLREFTTEKKNHRNDILWWQEQVFLFEDETENMC